MTPYVVGVDAGGTRTRGRAVSRAGDTLADAEGGPANALTVGVDAAADAVAESVQAVCSEGARPALICVGMAGIGRARERDQIAEALAARGLPAGGWGHDVAKLLAGEPLHGLREGQTLLDHDAMIALAACTGCKAGVVLVAGTGSIAFGVDTRGQRLRAGGWGHLFDDLGSACWIGREALAAVFRAYDGRGDATALSARTLQALGVSEVPMLTSCVHGSDNPKALMASLAPRCGVAASEGDAVAQRILDAAAHELACMVEAVVASGRFGAETVTVGLQGGAIANVAGLRERLSRRLAQSANVAANDAPLPPVAGAVQIAMNALRWC